ncbi:MAG TPA: glycosyltransferase, partial [Campylobacterales bacterium]|nr:glycosyltransferase [Campylobacterales bacterium]
IVSLSRIVGSIDYDFDILYKVKEIGEAFTFKDRLVEPCKSNAKIKLAYLTYGLADAGSVFAKFIHLFAKYHNQEEFEIVFFIPEREEQIYSKDHSLGVVKKIEEFGCRVVCAPNENNRFQRWLDTGKNITEYNPDLFITFAALARFEYYFIASVLPEKIKKVALVYGPPAQFVPPSFDAAIGRSKHPLFDTPIDIHATAPVFMDDAVKNNICCRANLAVPDNAIVLMSAGRYTKFKEVLFWEIVEDILNMHTDAYFVCIGASKKDINMDFDERVSDRIVFLGWRADVDCILPCADIYINTFPNGGGYTVREAVANKIPIVSFRNNYFKKFDQNIWNPIDEIVNVEDVLLELNDKTSFISVLSKLISDKNYREEIAVRCYLDAQSHIISPKKTIYEYEQTLKTVAK